MGPGERDARASGPRADDGGDHDLVAPTGASRAPGSHGRFLQRLVPSSRPRVDSSRRPGSGGAAHVRVAVPSCCLARCLLAARSTPTRSRWPRPAARGGPALPMDWEGFRPVGAWCSTSAFSPRAALACTHCCWSGSALPSAASCSRQAARGRRWRAARSWQSRPAPSPPDCDGAADVWFSRVVCSNSVLYGHGLRRHGIRQMVCVFEQLLSASLQAGPRGL